jgi:antitoxin component of MazEF toxin-antitoxin module
MITTLTNFGDSLGVRFPKTLLKSVQFFENDDVEVLVADNSIVIKRIERRKHLTTKERITAFSEAVEHVHFSETDWGKPQGREVW